MDQTAIDAGVGEVPDHTVDTNIPTTQDHRHHHSYPHDRHYHPPSRRYVASENVLRSYPLVGEAPPPPSSSSIRLPTLLSQQQQQQRSSIGTLNISAPHPPLHTHPEGWNVFQEKG